MTCTELILLLLGVGGALIMVGMISYAMGNDKGTWEEAERHKQDKLRKEGWVVVRGVLIPPREPLPK